MLLGRHQHHRYCDIVAQTRVYTKTDMFNLQFAQCNEDQRRTMHNATGTNINTNNNIANRIQREMGTKECLLHYVLGTKTNTVAKTTLFFNCCLKILKKMYEDARSFVCKRLSISRSFNRQFSIPLFHSLQHCEIHEQIDT